MGTYKVPQNVEAEDKILGPLSMKQFIYAMIGVGYAGLTFVILKKLILLWIIVGVPPALALLALGLYQREDQPMETFLIAIAGFLVSPKIRLWHKEPIAEVFHLNPPPPKPELAHRDEIKTHSQLEQLAHVIDTHGWASKEVGLQDPDTLPVVDLSDRLGGEMLTDVPTFGVRSDITESDDVFSNHSAMASGLTTLIENSERNIRAEAAQRMYQTTTATSARSISGSTSVPSGAIIKLATEGGDLTVAQLAERARQTA